MPEHVARRYFSRSEIPETAVAVPGARAAARRLVTPPSDSGKRGAGSRGEKIGTTTWGKKPGLLPAAEIGFSWLQVAVPGRRRTGEPRSTWEALWRSFEKAFLWSPCPTRGTGRRSAFVLSFIKGWREVDDVKLLRR